MIPGGTDPISMYLIYLESTFFVFFLFEIFVRFMSFRRKMDALADFWFRYDGVLVSLMVLEYVLVSIDAARRIEESFLSSYIDERDIFPMFRVVAVFRLVRLMRSMPEVVTLFKGIAAALKSTVAVIIVLAFELYLVAILFRARLGGPVHVGDETREEFELRVDNKFVYEFRTVTNALFYLFFSATLLDNITTTSQTLLHGPRPSKTMWSIFMIHMMISCLVVLNMLIGVICSVVTNVQETANEKGEIKKVKKILWSALENIDDNHNMYISPDEFSSMCDNANVIHALEKAGIDVQDLIELSDYIFSEHMDEEKGGISFGQFLEVVLNLRHSKTATTWDITDLRRYISETNQGHYEEILRLHHAGAEQLNALRQEIAELREAGGGARPRSSSVKAPPAPADYVPRGSVRRRQSPPSPESPRAPAQVAALEPVLVGTLPARPGLAPRRPERPRTPEGNPSPMLDARSIPMLRDGEPGNLPNQALFQESGRNNVHDSRRTNADGRQDEANARRTKPPIGSAAPNGHGHGHGHGRAKGSKVHRHHERHTGVEL